MQDAYRPHTHEELAALVSTGVAAGLAPNHSCGVLWYGRQRLHLGQRAENGPDRRIYRKTKKSISVGREKWIAVPVPDAGIPHEVVDAARERVKNNKRPAKSAKRAFWELSGGLPAAGTVAEHSRTSGPGQRRNPASITVAILASCMVLKVVDILRITEPKQ
jgi:hypothetical protein